MLNIFEYSEVNWRTKCEYMCHPTVYVSNNCSSVASPSLSPLILKEFSGKKVKLLI